MVDASLDEHWTGNWIAAKTIQFVRTDGLTFTACYGLDTRFPNAMQVECSGARASMDKEQQDAWTALRLQYNSLKSHISFEHACMNYLHTVDEIWPLKAELPKEELVAAGPQAAKCEHCVATARQLEELTAAVHALQKTVELFTKRSTDE